MTALLPVLMGSAIALSVATLLLLFTGNLWAMTVTAIAAVLLAALSIPTLDRQEQVEDIQSLDS
jgi:membrane protein implicated in regulation of membrane protease activity